MPFTATTFEIEIDILERRPELGDREAIALLRSEFRFAVNASHFIALSADDPVIAGIARSASRDATVRYVLALEFVPRHAIATEEAVIALIHSEFRRAFNASHFWRLTAEDPTVTVVSPVPAVARPQLRRAA